MAEENELTEFGEEIDSWPVNEFEKQDRSRNWYLISTIIAFLMMLFAFLTANFLFAVIIIIVALIFVLNKDREPDKVNVALTTEGVMVGKNFYDYDEIKNFAIIFKPHKGVKNIYFEFKSVLKHRLTVPLGDKDPMFVRDHLRKYLTENLERTDEPISEGLSRILKL